MNDGDKIFRRKITALLCGLSVTVLVVVLLDLLASPLEPFAPIIGMGIGIASSILSG